MDEAGFDLVALVVVGYVKLAYPYLRARVSLRGFSKLFPESM